MSRRILPALCLALCLVSTLLATVPATADTLLMENIDSASATATERPGRGLTMDQVQQVWGPPETRHAPVGDPPITRWDYPGFSVYFEYSRVIHSVRRK